MRKALLIAVVVACAIGAFALTAAGGERPTPKPPERTAAYGERPQTGLPPLPDELEPQVVEPVAGASGGNAAPEVTQQAPPTDAPKPDRAASSGDVELSRPSTAGDGIRQATALPNGIALPPLEAPESGKWVTIYSHEGHVFMEVAGIRFDTSGASETGSRWQNELRSTAGFVARHPPGL